MGLMCVKYKTQEKYSHLTSTSFAISNHACRAGSACWIYRGRRLICAYYSSKARTSSAGVIVYAAIYTGIPRCTTTYGSLQMWIEKNACTIIQILTAHEGNGEKIIFPKVKFNLGLLFTEARTNIDYSWGEWWKIISSKVKFNLGLLFTEARSTEALQVQ